MGWCSGSDIWYPVAKAIIENQNISNVDKVPIIGELIKALRDHDWDCCFEDELWETDVVHRAVQLYDQKLWEHYQDMLRDQEEDQKWYNDLPAFSPECPDCHGTGIVVKNKGKSIEVSTPCYRCYDKAGR